MICVDPSLETLVEGHHRDLVHAGRECGAPGGRAVPFPLEGGPSWLPRPVDVLRWDADGLVRALLRPQRNRTSPLRWVPSPTQGAISGPANQLARQAKRASFHLLEMAAEVNSKPPVHPTLKLIDKLSNSFTCHPVPGLL